MPIHNSLKASNPVIVTGYFDLQRNKWPYYSRDPEEYWTAFKSLSQLRNQIVLYTDNASYERASEVASNFSCNLIIYKYEPRISFDYLIRIVSKIQKSNNFISQINDLRSPEYWHPEYVIVNYIKAFLCKSAVSSLNLQCQAVAWVDFGYLRCNSAIPRTGEWKYAFPNDKITLFAMSPFNYCDINSIVRYGYTFFQGGCIVAPGYLWKALAIMQAKALNQLFPRALLTMTKLFYF